ncbi:DEAD/DEAH box helicase [Photobacterium sp. WH77]|uniref:DEAD/DEAH box helicase n=1 Tax=unclassified Photobacterium TaxID=2628852 RepID=UPI001EDB89AE|nr:MULTISPECIES: DEAD/DEAH box helicase [unclassified Photobacterium]MCG2835711.1 DEAD/DEAH box helicase [Photobacterium sp. WH77]MCG2843324.1 DEAD/DEAH box helicase [Photobacterium sp. WH80]
MQYLQSEASVTEELLAQILITSGITTKSLCRQISNSHSGPEIEAALSAMQEAGLVMKKRQSWSLSLNGFLSALQSLLRFGRERTLYAVMTRADEISVELEIYSVLSNTRWMFAYSAISPQAEGLLMHLFLHPDAWELLALIEDDRLKYSLQGWAWLLNQLYTTGNIVWEPLASKTITDYGRRQVVWAPAEDNWQALRAGSVSHPLCDPFDDKYFQHRTAFSAMTAKRYSYTALADLAVVALLDKPEAVASYQHSLDAHRSQQIAYDQFWQQQAYVIIAPYSEQEEYLAGVDDWFDSLMVIADYVSWGKLLLDVLMLCQWQHANPKQYQQWVAQVKAHPLTEVILSHHSESLLAARAKHALRYLTGQISESDAPFYVPAARQDIWLRKLTQTIQSDKEHQAAQRLVWELCLKSLKVQPRIQSMGKRGWTKGRVIQLYSIQYSAAEALMSDADWNVCQQLERQNRVRWGQPASDVLPVLKALSACDNIISQDGQSVSLHGVKPLAVLQASEQVTFDVFPRVANGTLRQVMDDAWCFLDTSAISPQFIDVIESRPEQLGSEHLQPLTEALEQQKDLLWYSPCQHKGNIKPGHWDARPHLWLDWHQGTLDVAIEHQNDVSGELPANRISMPSGQGETWISGPDQQWYQRDLSQEKADSLALSKHLGLKANKQRRWALSGEAALSLIKAVQNLQYVPVHWRQRSSQVKVLTRQDLTLDIEKRKNWFAVTGKASTDQHLELNLRLLLANSRQGFIEQDSDNLVVLMEDELQQQLRMLDGLLNEEMAVDVQMAYPLQQVLETFSHQGDAGWQSLQEKWSEKPVVAEHILAPLRDYQKTSVQWAAHLSHHGFGACLADDMGLGKTLQAISLIRHYKCEGAALVVAPKSVIHNWQAECQRFAPELAVVDLEQVDNRNEAIASAGEKTIVLVSYGLLTRCQEAMQAKDWQTIVLDEAQQIKNPQTKRAKLVFGLTAERRFTLTGTPVENHLTELWSQFAFLNPGLLGSLKQFRQKYSQAGRNAEDMMRLKALISPFIMRRMKGEVLSELPSKTEITHTVYLSAKESAAYEAVRKDALKTAKNSKGVVEVLAALTRLRQVCCDASLVFDSFAEESSKLREALALVTEAIEGGHQILVFSQFVQLLKRFAAQLEQASLSFSYLDGQSSSKQRKAAIEAFKAGKHPVFLISLKAGGTGLNLTEADTVIHLDPWWNPAVEDQASDRAHRMGQSRPVTVYRLVTENTVEEKIVQLHRDKRDLAEKVLSGQDDTQTLNPQMLLSMIED